MGAEKLPRYMEKSVVEDLQEKMVFVAGPRQVGKTTFALSLLPGGSETHPAYLNWDNASHRKLLMRGELPSGQSMIILNHRVGPTGLLPPRRGFPTGTLSLLQAPSLLPGGDRRAREPD